FCLSVNIAGPTNLQAGDRVLISAALTTTDENENGEGEPLVITANGATVATVSAYFATTTFEHLATEDETLSASIPGEDGDEDGSVGVTLITGQTPRFSREEKDLFNRLSAELNLEAARWSAASAKAAGLGTGSAFLAVLTSESG